MNVLQHTTELALHVCESYIDTNKIAVDCTCGNGHDTLWLAKRCKKVYAFDIQREAIASTSKLLESEGVKWSYEDEETGVVLIEDGHQYLKKYIEGSVDVIIFNLGFLPGGDKNITTKEESSLEAIKTALEILSVGGVLSVTMYPGHEEGAKEQDIILEWAKNLDSREYHCVFANMLNQSKRAPQILWVTKKK